MDQTPFNTPASGESLLPPPAGVPGELLTKRQLKARHPDGGYHIEGEYPPCKRGSRELSLPLCRYRAHNRVVYGVKGYVPCGEDGSYAAVLRNRLPLRAGMLAGCAALAVAAVVLFQTSPELPAALGLDPNAADYSINDGYNQGGSAGDSIEIPGYQSIPLAADSTQVTVDFRNPGQNRCYFVITLALEDGTQLYRSQLIPPGKGVQSITLNQPLPAGEHAASVRYEAYTMDDQTPLNGADIKVKLLAKSGL